MKQKQGCYRCLMLGAWLSILVLKPAFADFGVINDNQSSTNYGNAQTGSFHRAITGGNSLSPEDQQAVIAMLPIKEDGHFYGRARMAFDTLILEGIKNLSSGANKTAAVGRTRSVSNQAGLELAIGYFLSSNFRMDVEYLVNKNFNYVAKPVLTGTGITSTQMDAIIKNNAVLGNIYYDFAALERFKPYLTMGVGVSANSVQSTLTPTPAEGGTSTQRNLRVAWSLGAGIRIGIFSHWYMDASYRYIRLGSGINLQPNAVTKLQGDYTLNAMSIGFIYLF